LVDCLAIATIRPVLRLTAKAVGTAVACLR